jgi:TatD DNase family protein
MQPNFSSYINIHTHFKPQLNSEFAVRNAYLKLTAAQVEQLTYAVSVGLHPWHIHQMPLPQLSDRLIDLATQKNVWAIGEIGIDRSINTPISTQIQYFETQLNVARALQKPVIIHAVRSVSDLMPYLKKSKVPFVFHGFNGNIQQANELLKYSAKLSFGKVLFDDKMAEVFKQLPMDAFFLETDHSSVSIETIYQTAAQLKGLSVDELKSAVFNTFAACSKNV